MLFTSINDDVGGDTNQDNDEEEPAQPAGENWGGVVYNPGASGTITYAEFRYGGGETAGMVQIDRSSVDLRHCIFRNSGEDGIRMWNIDGTTQMVSIENGVFEDNSDDAIEGENVSPRIWSCTFTDNGDGVWLSGTSLPDFDGNLSSATGDAIMLTGATYERSGAWEYAGIPYILGGDITVPAGLSLTIEPGVIVKGNSHWHNLAVGGTLTAVGKPDSAIVFTSIEDDDVGGDTNRDGTQSGPDPDEWGGIVILSNGSGTLDYCQLRYGGGDGSGLVMVNSGGNASLDHCSLTRSQEQGLDAVGGRATIHNSIITRNEGTGVRNTNSSITVDATSNWWGDASGPFDDSNADSRINPDGQGDQVSDYVEYDPWLDVAPGVGTPVAPREPDSTPPVISGVAVADVTTSSATLTWTTSESTSSVVEYGPSTAYGQQASAPGYVTAHTVTLIGLTPETTYHFRVLSTDPAGNRATSPDHILTTRSVEMLIPVVTALNVAPTPTEGTRTATLSATITLSSTRPAAKVAFQRREVVALPDKTGQVAAKVVRIMALSLSNDFLSVVVSESAGFFDINTADNRHLIYGNGDTSYAKINIDGTIYMYGRDGRGSFTLAPTQEGNSMVSTWKVEDIAVTQRVSLVRSAVTGREDAAWIQYELRNDGSTHHNVGLYLEMDTMVSGNDAAPLSTSYGYSAVEQEFTGANMPTFWQAFEQGPTQSEDRLVAQGTLIGGGAIAPDRFVVGPYGRLVEVSWDYTIAGDSYGDSAVGMWWNPVSVGPGDSRTVATFYGLGQGTVSTGTLALNVSAPAELTVVDNALSPNPFEINVLVSNTGGASAAGVEVALELPAGLSLAAGESLRKALNPSTLPAGQTGQVAWRVRAESVAAAVTHSYMVRVTSTTAGVEANQLTRSITIPATARSLYVAAAEAFRGADPGEGSGWAMRVADGAFDETTEDVILALDVSGWALGTYAIGVRGQASDGRWGPVRQVDLAVTASPITGTIPVVLTCPETVRPGEVMTVALGADLSEVPDRLGAYDATITWNPSLLDYTEAQAAAFGSVTYNTTQLDQGRITFNSFNQSGADGQVELAILKFNVIGEAGQSGTLSASFVEVSATSATSFRNLLPQVQVTPCEFAIARGGLLGDVDANGRVSIRDALIVATYVADNTIALPPGSDISLGDVDANSRISIRDALIIATYVADPNNPSLPEGISRKPALLAGEALELGDRLQVFVHPTVDTRAYRLQLDWDPQVLSLVRLSPEPAAMMQQAGSVVLADLSTEPLRPLELEFRALLPANSGALVPSLEAVAVDFSEGQVELSVQRVPQAFALRPNFPNPFNPHTTIRYTLPEPAPVALMIYDLHGQRIRTLVQQEQIAGYYQVRWDGRDAQNRAVGSGVYFYCLEAGNFVQTRRMMLLK